MKRRSVRKPGRAGLPSSLRPLLPRPRRDQLLRPKALLRRCQHLLRPPRSIDPTTHKHDLDHLPLPRLRHAYPLHTRPLPPEVYQQRRVDLSPLSKKAQYLYPSLLHLPTQTSLHPLHSLLVGSRHHRRSPRQSSISQRASTQERSAGMR